MGAGLVVQLANTWWGMTVPLLPEIDNTTVELVALAVGRWIVERLSDLGAMAGEVVYHAQAAEALVAGAPQSQSDPMHRPNQWCDTIKSGSLVGSRA